MPSDDQKGSLELFSSGELKKETFTQFCTWCNRPVHSRDQLGLHTMYNGDSNKLRINSPLLQMQSGIFTWVIMPFLKKTPNCMQRTIHDNWLKKSTFIGHDNEFKLSYSKENKDQLQHFCVHVQGSMLPFLPVAQLIRLLMRFTTSTKWTKMIKNHNSIRKIEKLGKRNCMSYIIKYTKKKFNRRKMYHWKNAESKGRRLDITILRQIKRENHCNKTENSYY